MNSVVEEAAEWPPHLKLVPSNENARNPNEYQYKPLCNARRLYFCAKIAIFTTFLISMQILRQIFSRESTPINLK